MHFCIMTMAFRLLFAIVLGLMPLVLSNPVTPALPTITQPPYLQRRDSASPDWIGYYMENSTLDESFTSQTCGSGKVFTTIGTIGNCCPTTVSNWRENCSSSFFTTCMNQIVIAAATTWECSPYYCSPWTIYTGSTSDTNPLFWFGCASQLEPTSIYQQSPLNANAVTSTSEPSSPSTSPTPSQTPSTAPSQTASPSPTPAPKKASKAWIAGVVVGSLSFIALAGLVFYLIRRRNKSKEQSYQIAPQMQPAYPQHPFPQGDTTSSTISQSLSPHEHKRSFVPSVASADDRSSLNPNTLSVYSQTKTSQTTHAQIPTQGVTRMPNVEDLPELVTSGR